MIEPDRPEQSRWKFRNTRTFNLLFMAGDAPPGAEDLPHHDLWFDSHIWQNVAFHALNTEGQMTMMYLLTTGQAKPWETPYPLELEDIAAEFGQDLAMLERGFAQGVAHGFVETNVDGEIVLLPPLLAFVAENDPEGQQGEA